jgi:hypothetical protein
MVVHDKTRLIGRLRTSSKMAPFLAPFFSPRQCTTASDADAGGMSAGDPSASIPVARLDTSSGCRVSALSAVAGHRLGCFAVFCPFVTESVKT